MGLKWDVVGWLIGQGGTSDFFALDIRQKTEKQTIDNVRNLFCFQISRFKILQILTAKFKAEPLENILSMDTIGLPKESKCSSTEMSLGFQIQGC